MEVEVEVEAALQYLVSRFRLPDEMKDEVEAEKEVHNPLWKPSSAGAQHSIVLLHLHLLVHFCQTCRLEQGCEEGDKEISVTDLATKPSHVTWNQVR